VTALAKKKLGRPSDPEGCRLMGERVYLARHKRGLTQTDVALLIGTHRNAVGLIEKGRNYPGHRLVPVLCRALKVTPNYLYGWETT